MDKIKKLLRHILKIFIKNKIDDLLDLMEKEKTVIYSQSTPVYVSKTEHILESIACPAFNYIRSHKEEYHSHMELIKIMIHITTEVPRNGSDLV